MAQEETTTKTEVGYIECVKLFAETMRERYIKKGAKTSLVILAGDGEGTQLVQMGDAETNLDSMANALVQNERFLQLVKTAISVIALHKLKEMLH